MVSAQRGSDFKQSSSDPAHFSVALPDESMLGKHLLETSIQAPTHGKALPVLNNP